GDDDRVFGGAGALGLANGARAHAHAAFAVAGAGALVRPLTVFPAQGARLAIAVAVARAAHAAARAIDARELAEVGLPLSDVVAVLRLNAAQAFVAVRYAHAGTCAIHTGVRTLTADGDPLGVGAQLDLAAVT